MPVPAVGSAVEKKKKKKKKKSKAGKSSVASATLIVKRLMELAAEPDSRSFIVQDGGCLSGLVKYLKHKNETVYTMAACKFDKRASKAKDRSFLTENPKPIFKRRFPGLS